MQQNEGIYGEIPENVKVYIKGGEVQFEENISSKKLLQITVGQNSKVFIREGCQFFGNVTIFLRENSTCIIEKNCRLIDSRIVCDSNATVVVGEDTSINDNTALYCRYGHKIEIGRDCMFAQDIVLHAGDAHPIYDTSDMRLINEYPENSANAKIVLDEHVWVGWGAMILQNTEIGSGSIVGAKSLVKGKFPNNCVLAGNPAKVKRSNTGWKRYAQCDTPEEYMQLTQADYFME